MRMRLQARELGRGGQRTRTQLRAACAWRSGLQLAHRTAPTLQPLDEEGLACSLRARVCARAGVARWPIRAGLHGLLFEDAATQARRPTLTSRPSVSASHPSPS